MLPPPSFPETGRPEVFAPPNLCNALLSHPEPPVQTAQCRATPCYEPLWQAAAPCWGSRRHRERGVAASEGSEDATEVFAGLRSGRIGAKMPFEIPIHRLKFLYTILPALREIQNQHIRA